MGYATSGDSSVGNAALGLVGAVVCVVGWGSEAVLCAWGMRDDAVDNETALQIRETTSAIVYAVVVLPAFGAWAFTASALPSISTAVVMLSASRVRRRICSTTRVSQRSARRAAWRSTSRTPLGLSCSDSCFLGSVPTVVQIVCCLVIMAGTVLAACDWDELFGRKKTPLPEDAS